MIGDMIFKGAQALFIKLPPEAPAQFDAYYEMLLERNRHMNLARALDDPDEAAHVHFLDSLAPLPLMKSASSLVDVGSGAGFPGIALAIARPEMRIVLIDSLKKRVAFLNEVIEALSLNAAAIHARSEDASKLPEYREQFDIATARAVAELEKLSQWTLPLVRVGGRVLAYKGPAAKDEVARAKKAISALGGDNATIEPIAIPGRPDWQHVVVQISKVRSTPQDYKKR